MLLRDLHYDKLAHHDFAWLEKKHPNDLNQIKNYARLTAEIMPRLLATLRDMITDLNRSPAPPLAFVLQVGDLVEGLCGNEGLATRQNTEALAYVRDARLGVSFVFVKGNHDITGDGASAAFASVFHPFLTEQARALTPATDEICSAHSTVRTGHAKFAFFDAYDRESPDWFEAVAARRTAEHFFAIVHPPSSPPAPGPRGINSPRKKTGRNATNSSNSSAASAPSSSAATFTAATPSPAPPRAAASPHLPSAA